MNGIAKPLVQLSIAVTGNILRQREIPLAPLPEQQRIVARIDELFTQLDAGVSGLRRVQAGLKRYKASVLKAAVEGRLSGHGGAVPVQESGLPQGWSFNKLGDVFTVTIGGTPSRTEIRILEWQYCLGKFR